MCCGMDAPALKRHAGPLALLLANLSGMIGSGWLFGALNAARIAGPAAMVSWVIGGAAALLLAFVYAELTTAFPRAGAIIAFPKLSHGPLAAQIMGWIVLLAYVAVPPVEAVAVMTYANNLHPGLVHANGGGLTHIGLIGAILLLILFILINLAAIRIVLAISGALTWWKLAVPVLTGITFCVVHFHGGNFTAQKFAPAGANGILAAVSGSGIMFTFLGFRHSVELAGESSNPARTLPLSILGSVFICLALYLLLQFAFIGALSPADIAHGWARVTFPGVTGPFAGLATALGLSWLAVLLYIDAVVSPAGTGIIYATSSTRVLFALGEAGLMSKRLTAVSQAGVPIAGLAVSFVFGLVFLLLFPSWKQLVTTLTSIGILSYGIGPVVLLTLRHTVPVAAYPRPFQLRAVTLISGGAFMISNFIVIWAGVKTATPLFAGLLVFALLYLAKEFFTARTLAHLHWRHAAWLPLHFLGLWLIMEIGPKTLTGGLSYVSTPIAMAITVALSVFTLWLAIRSGLPDPAEARAALRK
jgi:amino acid transporter